MTTLTHTARRALRAFAPALALGVAGLTVACADGPTGPGAPVAARTTTTTTATSAAVAVRPLLRAEPLTADLTKSWAVTSAHHTLEWPEVGLRVDVPANTVPRAGMTITVRALKGKVVAYDFGPDGSKFPYALTVAQRTQGTNFAQVADRSQVQGGYFRSAAQVDGVNGAATVDEFQPTSVDPNGAWVTFKVTHFSGYLMSTGYKLVEDTL